MSITKLPTIRTMTRNILRTFAESTPEEVATGFDWYGRARRFSEELADTTPGANRLVGDDWDAAVARAAAVVAVLSPRLSWPKNMELASAVFANYGSDRTVEELAQELPTLKANGRKAYRILFGETPDDVVSGPKVRAFWRTIVDPTDPRAVVVDRHAIDVAVGRVLDDRTRGLLLGRKGAYEAIASAYAAAARQLDASTHQGATPAGVQAVTWEWWRANRAAANHGTGPRTVKITLSVTITEGN